MCDQRSVIGSKLLPSSFSSFAFFIVFVVLVCERKRKRLIYSFLEFHSYHHHFIIMSLEEKLANLTLGDDKIVVETVKKEGVEKSGLAANIEVLAARCASQDDNDALLALKTLKALVEQAPESHPFTKDCLTACKYYTTRVACMFKIDWASDDEIQYGGNEKNDHGITSLHEDGMREKMTESCLGATYESYLWLGFLDVVVVTIVLLVSSSSSLDTHSHTLHSPSSFIHSFIHSFFHSHFLSHNIPY